MSAIADYAISRGVSPVVFKLTRKRLHCASTFPAIESGLAGLALHLRCATLRRPYMTLRRIVSPLMCLLVVALGATTARADTWDYTFSGTNTAPGGDGLAVSFEFVTQAPITTAISLLSVQLISCTNCIVSSSVPAVEFSPNDVFGDQIGFNDINNNGNVFMFPFGAFQNPGTYVTLDMDNPGTLTVIVTATGPGPTPTPEPSSLVLFLSGLGGIVTAARRKLLLR
jgi:PEP-CTERM motif